MQREQILPAIAKANGDYKVPPRRGPDGRVVLDVPETAMAALLAIDPDPGTAIRKLVEGPDPVRADLLERFPALCSILDDPAVSHHQKALAALPYVRQLRDESSRKLVHAEKLERELVLQRGLLGAVSRLKAWGTGERFTLETNDCSRLHQLADAMRGNHVIIEGSDATAFGERWSPEVLKAYHPFVVAHDWARAFEGAGDYHEGVVQLPYDHCAFEFVVSGRPVIVMAMQLEGGPAMLLPFLRDEKLWCLGHDMYVMGDLEPAGWYGLVVRQVRAICIALEAEVAEHDVVRAPAKLNQKRERAGKLPLLDYHVVRLGARSIARRPGPLGAGERRGPRLHFRRGHWRHYESHRTWVKWMLVGHPDLGWIDKEYRL